VAALLGERLKWHSFGHFSVATKVPVEIFCVSGPIVMVTAVLYALLVFLLASERATSTVFYISACWSIIFVDMSAMLYSEWRDLLRGSVDVCLHSVNLVIVGYALLHMPYVPSTFILISFGCWYVSALGSGCRAAASPSRHGVRVANTCLSRFLSVSSLILFFSSSHRGSLVVSRILKRLLDKHRESLPSRDEHDQREMASLAAPRGTGGQRTRPS
jgi:hypothetical protein